MDFVYAVEDSNNSGGRYHLAARLVSRNICTTEMNLVTTYSVISRRMSAGSIILAFKATMSYHVKSILRSTHQAQIAYFKVAVSIDKQISRFKITMKNVCRMQIFQSTKNLTKR